MLAASGDGAALHRREVLGLVDDDVAVTARALQEAAQFVEEHQVGRGPPDGLDRSGRFRPGQGVALGGGEQAVGGFGAQLGIGEQLEQGLARGDRRPDGVEERGEGAAGPAHPGGVGGVAAGFGLAGDDGDQAGAHPFAAGKVGQVGAAGVVDDAAGLLLAHPPVEGAVLDLGGAARPGDPGEQGTAQHPGHADVVFERGGLRGVVAGGLAEQGVERGLLDLDLAQRGQDGGDVAQKGAVGAKHKDAGAFEPAPMRVEQESGPVQPHGGLAGAGAALHTDRLGQIGADEGVLVGLDGGHDVAHRAHARPLDLGGDDRTRTAVRALNGAARVLGEVFVLEAGQGAAGPAETAAHADAERVGRAGAVEGARDGARQSMTTGGPPCSPVMWRLPR